MAAVPEKLVIIYLCPKSGSPTFSVCDEIPLSEAGICKDSKLVLEPGQAPTSNQVMLEDIHVIVVHRPDRENFAFQLELILLSTLIVMHRKKNKQV